MSTGYFHVATCDAQVLIKVYGNATQKNSHFFREFTNQMLKMNFEKFIVDLANCEIIDSTFIGVLLEITCFSSQTPISVTLVNTNERHQNAIKNLGISHFLEIAHSSFPIPDIPMCVLKEDNSSEEKRLQVIQEAHECLMKVNETNKKRFQDFIQLLEEELSSRRKAAMLKIQNSPKENAEEEQKTNS